MLFILQESNRLQMYLHELNNNLCFLSENTDKFESSLLGHNLNPSFDKNFTRITDLKKTFENLSDSSNNVKLSIQFEELALRQEVFSLTSCYIKMYFTRERAITFESFTWQES